jgi:hypothetical protein
VPFLSLLPSSKQRNKNAKSGAAERSEGKSSDAGKQLIYLEYTFLGGYAKIPKL